MQPKTSQNVCSRVGNEIVYHSFFPFVGISKNFFSNQRYQQNVNKPYFKRQHTSVIVIKSCQVIKINYQSRLRNTLGVLRTTRCFKLSSVRLTQALIKHSRISHLSRCVTPNFVAFFPRNPFLVLRYSFLFAGTLHSSPTRGKPRTLRVNKVVVEEKNCSFPHRETFSVDL